MSSAHFGFGKRAARLLLFVRQLFVRIRMAALRQATHHSLLRPSKLYNYPRNLSTRIAPASRSPITTGLYATALLLSTSLFAVYYFDPRSAIHKYVIMPVLRHTLDAEASHKVAVKVLRSGLGPKDHAPDDEKLALEVSLRYYFPYCAQKSMNSSGDNAYQILLDSRPVSTKMEKQ